MKNSSAGQPRRSRPSPAQARPHRWPSQQKTSEKTSKQASRQAKNQWKEQATFGQTDFAKNDFGENWDRVMSQDNINIKKKCLSLSGMFSANGSIVIYAFSPRLSLLFSPLFLSPLLLSSLPSYLPLPSTPLPFVTPAL